MSELNVISNCYTSLKYVKLIDFKMDLILILQTLVVEVQI